MNNSIIYNCISSFIVCAVIGGCAPFNLNHPKVTSPKNELTSIVSDANRENNPDSANTRLEIDDEFALNAPFDELSELGLSEKLATASRLLDYAFNFQSEGNLTSAENSFERARFLIASVEIDSLGNRVEFYKDIVADINHYYDNYVAALEVLPEESPPEAVIAGVLQAEGDSLNGDTTVFMHPEISFDSTELKAALDTAEAFPPVPLIVNKKVKNAISFFQHKGRKVFQRWLERGGYYIPIMTQILREEGLPEDLVYLSMIESGFNPKAYSYAHASGPWQFIRSTARIFGMKSDWWYDERRVPEKSTRAASKYLKKLYLEFDDWYLALAAYNCGEGKIARHIRKYKTRDFWKLKRIPRQTRNYIPTFIAAAIIAKNPAKYGFKDIDFKARIPVDSVLVTDCIDLELAAKMVESDFKTIKKLNPAIVRWCTPPTIDSVWLYLPQGTADKFTLELAKVPTDQKRSWVRHKVRPGEALSSIARRYGTTVRAIMDVRENRIWNKHRIKAGKHLLIPVPPHRYKPTRADYAYEPEFTPPANRDKVIYTVRRGDNLSLIAQRYSTSARALKRWNNLYNKRYIYPGQKLVVWVKSSGLVSAQESYKKSTPASGDIPHYHRVKSGESLWLIAKKYGISFEKLKRINGLSGRSIIRPGDELLLKEYDETLAGTSKGNIIYTVKKGDTLWDIAQNYQVRLSDLKRINRLSGSSIIRPGDQLQIPVN